MSLTLYLHPLASYCHKVLIALYENQTPFRPVTVDFANPGSAAEHLDRWPLGKIPILHDSARNQTVPETSIILEYLHQHYPGPLPLLPADPATCLQTRLWDRFFDLYISTPMQKIVLDRLRPDTGKDPVGVAEAHQTLDTAYAMINTQTAAAPWAAGHQFTMADCSATPALFYASILHPFGPEHPHLAAYFERLLQRPSIRRTLAEAQPFFPMFPFHDAMPARFLAPIS